MSVGSGNIGPNYIVPIPAGFVLRHTVKSRVQYIAVISDCVSKENYILSCSSDILHTISVRFQLTSKFWFTVDNVSLDSRQ